MIEFWFFVYAEPTPIRRGDGFSLRIVDFPFREQCTRVSIDLARVGWEETTWWWGSSAELVTEGTVSRVTVERLDVPAGVYTISRLRFSLGPDESAENVIDMLPGKDFPRVFLQVVDDLIQPTPQSELAKRVELIEGGRDRLFLFGIVADPDNPGIGRFRGFAFATRSLITRRMRLGQLEVVPLRRALHSLEHAAVINETLEELGSRPIVDPTGTWARRSEQAFPLMVVHMPLIYARGRDEAFTTTERYALAVIDVLSPHRMSYGEVFAFVVESLDSPSRRWYQAVFEGYRGNLAGGFLGGEEPSALRSHLANVLADPMLRLFVSLYREATAETDLDFAYFRFWNLLEAIATRRISAERGHEVRNFEGQRILSPSGGPINTTTTTARVFELIKSHFETRGLKESFLLAGAEMQDLWSVCQTWAGYRNATAHYGGFNVGDAEQSRRPWFALTSRAYVEVTKEGHSRDRFSDVYFRALAETARFIVIWEMEKP